jgi:hypothetical protein
MLDKRRSVSHNTGMNSNDTAPETGDLIQNDDTFQVLYVAATSKRDGAVLVCDTDDDGQPITITGRWMTYDPSVWFVAAA